MASSRVQGVNRIGTERTVADRIVLATVEGCGSRILARQIPGLELSEADRGRALARFGSLRSRGLNITFKSVGPVVKADNPSQLEAAVAQALGESS